MSVSAQDGEDWRTGVRNKEGCSGDHATIWSPFLQVNNLSPLKLAVRVNFWVPVLLNGVAVWDVTLSSPAQVPACSISLSTVPLCNNAMLLPGGLPLLLGCLLRVPDETSSESRLSDPDSETFCAGEQSPRTEGHRNVLVNWSGVVSLRCYTLYSVLAFILSFCLSLRKGPLSSALFPSCPQDCSIADCLHFRCDIPSLGIQDELDFILRGNLSFGWVSQVCSQWQSCSPGPCVPDGSGASLGQGCS